MKFNTKIISAFHACGKTTYHLKHQESTLDSDSSKFSWCFDDNGNKIRHPLFPQNYIEHIMSNLGEFKYIFVSSHKEVREALLNNSLFFYLVYPSNDRKQEFLQRCKDRGNDENFISLIDKNWDKWIDEIYWMEGNLDKIEMVLDNLEDELDHLEAVEYGEVLN